MGEREAEKESRSQTRLSPTADLIIIGELANVPFSCPGMAGWNLSPHPDGFIRDHIGAGRRIKKASFCYCSEVGERQLPAHEPDLVATWLTARLATFETLGVIRYSSTFPAPPGF